MKSIQDSLNVQRDSHSEQVQQNQDLRTQISEKIDIYKAKEQDYKAFFSSHTEQIMGIERKLKDQIEKTLMNGIKKAEVEKDKFSKLAEGNKNLSERIQDYLDKFNRIKEEMVDNNKKFENYQGEIETKKLNIQVLETEIVNVRSHKEQDMKVKGEIDEERIRLLQ